MKNVAYTSKLDKNSSYILALPGLIVSSSNTISYKEHLTTYVLKEGKPADLTP